MDRLTRWIFILCFLSISCNPDPSVKTIEKWKAEIVETEKDFATMAKEEGIAQAFLTFAAEDAVLMRSNQVIVGKEAIRAHFENNPPQAAGLEWTPDFVDVAASRDLGYTYGQYVLTTRDTSGNLQESRGIFHTVWKRQPDGTWKFVWD